MKQMTMAEIRESLAKDDAENIDDYRDKFDIFLNGCPGYNNYENDDCIDYYIQRNFPDWDVEDDNPVVLMEVLDDGNGQVFAKVIQHEGEVDIEFV